MKRYLLLFLFIGLFSSQVSAEPERVVSLGPRITESIYILGAEDKLVGCTVYCNRPAAVEQKPKVATVIDINLEKIVSLQPDLVLATSLTSPKDKQALEWLGIKVVAFSKGRTFDDLCAQFLKLAQILGKTERADQIVRQAKAQVELLREAVKDRPRQRVFIQVGSKPLVAATDDYFVNDFISLAGGVNVADQAGDGIYSREAVLQEDPDVIIIVTMGLAAQSEQKVWAGFSSLKAARQNRIYIVDADKVCSPTPIGFAQTLEEIIAILHPEK